MISIDKSIGVWDIDNISELDSLAYTHFCVTHNIFWGKESHIIPISHFIKDKHLHCFYKIARNELRAKKIKNLTNAITTFSK